MLIFSRSFFGEGEEIDCAIGAETDQHPKAASLALPWTSDPLLDDPTTEIGVDQALPGALNGLDKAGIVDTMLTGKLRKCPGFENTQVGLYSSINYSL